MKIKNGFVKKLILNFLKREWGKYSSVFFHNIIPWATLFWLFFRKHLFHENEVYLLPGDQVVITKVGKHSYAAG